MSDTDIVELIRQGRDHKAFVKLYAHLPKVERHVRANSGTKADAKDLFQEALIILHRKVNTPGFTLTAGLGTYLFAICRNLWLDELRRRDRFTTELSAEPDEPSDLEGLLKEEKQFGLAERALRSLGDKCLDLLKRFYLANEPLVAIAQAIGLAGEGAAKTRKYKCLEEARKRYREMLAKGAIVQPNTH